VSARALIPIKSFERGKTRLRARLDERARRDLARQMFESVLHACFGCARLDGVLVLTDDEGIAEHGRAAGAAVLRDLPGAVALAQVVDAGLAELRADGASEALVLMADLPLLHAGDVNEIMAVLDSSDLVLAPDRSGRCTNALALRLAAAAELRTAFGAPDSLALHAARSRALGLRVAFLDNPRLALDVDVPADLDLMRGLHQD
jgi:2-phospho-L-lactate guanylyltransferase